MSYPISFNIVLDRELETSNTAVVVLNAYTTTMVLSRDERKAFDAAVRAWRERNPNASPEQGPPAVATIISHKLEATSLLTVFVPKPAGVSYGEAMSRLRIWLDNENIQSTMFKLSPLGRIGFEIGFRSNEDATRFLSGFGWPQA